MLRCLLVSRLFYYNNYLKRGCFLKNWILTIVASKYMMSQSGQQAIIVHIFPNILQSKGKQTLKIGQLIQYNKKHLFSQKPCRK